jgi:hypothetical protein
VDSELGYVYEIHISITLLKERMPYLTSPRCLRALQVMWRLKKSLAGLKNNNKTFHNSKKMGNKFKNMMENKKEVINNNKKKPCSSLYKRFSMKICLHSWAVGLLGLINLHKGIHPQTILY